MNNDNKTPNEIIKYQPDALEIKNERLPWAIRMGVWIPFFVLTAAIVWSCLAQVDVVVQSTGQLVTDRPTIVMKPLERSVIKKINVKIGDIVKKDDILITFDPAFNNAEAERLKSEMLAFNAQLSRLRAEFQNIPYTGGSNQFEKWQLAIYKQRQEYYRERMNYFREALSQIAASKKSKQDNLGKQRERLAAIKQLEDMFKELHGKKAASLKDLLQMSVTRMEMEATVDQLENDLLELNHRRGTIIAERNSFIQEWRNELSEEMVTADRNLTANAKNYEKVAKLIEYVYLRAPCDAVVHEIASFSPGSAVQEAEALITLIPLDGNLELETEIRTQDIGKVAKAAQARIKLNAYPFQKHGTLNGIVRNISENTLKKTIQGQELTYYRARVVVSGKLKGIKENFRLIPGMEAQCEIKCGRRRVIEFVLHPLIKALDETAREP
ncbi:MAG: HlyD family type I secretion periplasmic adaptor subunit [Lentisphaerae bacterium]|nr:HlyD family type I secretion periplasmic adaptor subunit [Lentisphaerota bacterium]